MLPLFFNQQRCDANSPLSVRWQTRLQVEELESRLALSATSLPVAPIVATQITLPAAGQSHSVTMSIDHLNGKAHTSDLDSSKKPSKPPGGGPNWNKAVDIVLSPVKAKRLAPTVNLGGSGGASSNKAVSFGPSLAKILANPSLMDMVWQPDMPTLPKTALSGAAVNLKR